MSERITRRTFLKASGAAVLAAAAGGMLAGCGGGTDGLLNVSSLPTVGSDSFITYNSSNSSYDVGMGAFENCRSNSQHESSGVQHYYLYTAVTFQQVSSPITVSTNDFQFTFITNSSKIPSRKASSLANYTLDSSTDKYKATTSRSIGISSGSTTIPLWVDLGSYFDVPTTHIGEMTVTYKNKVVFKYADPSFNPSTSQV